MTGRRFSKHSGGARAAAILGLVLLAGCPMRKNPDLSDDVDCDPVTHVGVGMIAMPPVNQC